MNVHFCVPMSLHSINKKIRDIEAKPAFRTANGGEWYVYPPRKYPYEYQFHPPKPSEKELKKQEEEAVAEHRVLTQNRQGIIKANGLESLPTADWGLVDIVVAAVRGPFDVFMKGRIHALSVLARGFKAQATSKYSEAARALERERRTVWDPCMIGTHKAEWIHLNIAEADNLDEMADALFALVAKEKKEDKEREEKAAKEKSESK